MQAIHTFDNYFDVLRNFIASKKDERGTQSRLATELSIHPSYLSRILKEEVHLTPDQGALFCKYLHLDLQETRFFLLLLQLARAATRELREFTVQEINLLRKELKKLEVPLEQTGTQIQDLSIQYHSTWEMNAVHMLLTIPKFRKKEEIAKKLGLKIFQVERILEELINLEIVQKKGEEFLPLNFDIHLPSNHALTSTQIIQGRLKACNKANERDARALQYTGVHSLSGKDFEKINELLRESIRDVRQRIQLSPEEDLVCFNVDWFKV